MSQNVPARLGICRYQDVFGLSQPILETSNIATKYVNIVWVNNFIDLLQDHGLQIKLKQKFVHAPQRINDRFVMDDITKITSSRLTLQRLNACRMYLQVTLLSEIIDIQGHQITSSATRGVRNPNQNVPSSGRYRNIPIQSHGTCGDPQSKNILQRL